MKVEANVKGMHCDSCIKIIKMNVEDLPGIKEVTGDWHTGNVSITFNEKLTTAKAVLKQVALDGYTISTHKETK